MVERLEFRQLLAADISLSLVGTDSLGSGNVYLSRPVDYNGDGLLDMATANNGNNTFNVYLGTGNGLFSFKSTIATQGVEPYGSDSGDFNGDGILDIAIANLGTGSISVFQGVGDGTFSFLNSITSLPGTYHLVVTDLDADGKADIAANQTSPSGVVVFRGLGDGNFSTRNFYATGAGTTHVYAADIDNDGAKDLLTSTFVGNSVSILYGLKSVDGNPTGSFGVAQSLPFSSGVFDLSISDFDGDGWKDIATANRGDGTGSIFRGLGNRQFMQLPSLSVGAQPYSIQAADLNHDGVPDLVFNSLTESKFTVWAGLGNGSFEQKLTLPVTNAYRIALADLDGNGTTDMLGSSAGNGQFRIWLNGATTTRTTLSLLAPASAQFGSPVSVTVRALSPNGSVDTAFAGIVQFKSSDPFAQLPADYTFTAADQGVKSFPLKLKSTGNQTISATLIGSNGIVSGKVVSVAPPLLANVALSLVGTDSSGSGNVYLSRPVDYNGDGLLDMATANNGNNALNIYLGTNNGLFNLKSTIPTQGVEPYGSDSGDFNGDGILDIAVANSGTSSISVFQGVGDGTFLFLNSLTALPGTYHLVVTDLDADGKADIAANQTSPSGVVVFRGLGNGSFSNRDFYATGATPTHVYAVDIDNDGAKDLLTSTYVGNAVSILYGLKSVVGNPTGTFGASQSLPFSSGAFDLSISDFDGDGWKDIATANRSDGTGGIFRGLGNRQFMQLPSLSVGAQPYSIQAADLNHDGVPDLVFNSLTESKFTVWAGLGNGSFEQKLTLPVTNAYRIALADFDGNGTTDMLGSSAGNGQFRIWLNGATTTRTTLSLLAPSSAQFGSPVSVTVRALSPNGSVDTAFTGTVQFKSSDRLAQLPADYTFTAADQGLKTFTVTLQSYGSQTISATLVGANGVVAGKVVYVGSVTADEGGPYSVAAGTALFLDGTNSSSATSHALTYQWDLDYDGLAFQADASGSTPFFDASQMVGGQQRTVALRVTDSAGFSDTSVTTVSVVGLNSELDGALLATEELVNSTTSRDQMYPALAMNKKGQSVVVYESGSNGTLDLDILAQRYNVTGTKVAGETQVNLGAFDERIRPGVAMADDGRYIVAWQGWAADAQGWGINAQRFDKDGNKVGSQFIVNLGWESGFQVEVDLAISPDGTKFVVVWEDSQNDGSGQGVFASLFDWNGGLLNTVLVNNYTSGAQDSADVEMLATGGFVVTWASQYQDGSGYGIFARRFNASGNPTDSTDIQINRFTTGNQTQPDLATRNGQEYIITWQTAISNRGTDIVAQRFDSNFNRIGSEFIVNETSTGDQYSPAVAIASNGFATFTWTSPGQDGSGFGIFARTMGPGTNQLGHEFQINSVSVGDQNTRGSRQSIAYTPTGETVVTWWGNGPGDNVGVFQRRFASHNHVVSPITDENTLPNQIAENSAIGSDVGIRALALDADVYDTVTYSLDDSAGNRFAINPTTGVITVAVAIDRETAAIYNIVVRAESTDTSYTTKSFTIDIADVDEFNTSSIIDANAIANTVPENAPNGTLVNVTAFASDADATNNGITYSLDDSSGGQFAIDPATGVVQVSGAIDRETAASYDIVVRATSTDSSFTTNVFTIAVTDVDEFDTSSIIDTNAIANTIPENAPNGTLVNVTAFALDADATNNGITYSLDDSAGGRFGIDPATGVVQVSNAIDRETAASYDIVVRATSTDSSFTTKSFTIAVTDIDEFDTSTIIDANAIANTVPENSPNGTLVNVTAFASDADATNNGITYSLDDSAGGRFAIDPATGIVSVASAIDYETGTNHTVVARASSADGSFSTASFLISVQDVNEGVVFSGTAGNDTLKFWPGPSEGQFYFKRNAEANVLFTANGSVTINGGGGVDTLVIEGTNLTNQFDVYTDRVRYSNVDFYGNQIATRQINALGSGDTINAYGGTANVNGGSAVDRLVALTPGNQVWMLTAPNVGSLNGQIFFTSVESLIGSDGDDQFFFGPTGSVSGRIEGGIGANILDYTNVTTALNFNLQTGAATKTGGTSNITRIIGGSAIDTLTAANVTNQWTVSGEGSGTVNGNFSFNGIENLAGGSLSDAFTLDNTSLVTGNLSGGGGADSIEYQSNENLLVDLATSTASKIAGTFSSIAQITFGTGVDTVVGRNLTSNWNVGGSNSVTTSGVAFQNVETLVGGSGMDTLIGTAQNNQWNLDGSNAGRLGGLGWSGIENLTGGTGDDAFLIAASASVSGLINGGNGFDVLDYRAFGASVTVDLSIANSNGVGKFTSISTIFGSAANDTIIGADNANSWSFTASGGVVDGLAFDGFENWQGGTGTDSLSGPNAANIWTVTSANSGSVADVIFNSMENLIGNSQLDTFAFQGVGSISGQINGGLGEDVLDYSGSSSAVVVNLFSNSTSSVGSFTSISMILGSTANDTLVGANNANTWTITSPSTFTVNSLRVGNIESLVGGTALDVFRAKEGVEYFGSIDGGAGVDRLEYTAFASAVSVNLGLGTATGFASVTRIENITGGNSDDFLVGDTFDNVISGGNGDDVLLGMAGNDTLNGNIGRDLLFGGSGADLIRGSNGEDILIGGLTNYAQEASGIIDRTAIDAIMLEWRRTDATYAQRIDRLNGTTQGGLNGAYVLNAATLIDDEDVDDLWGDAGLDWFWAGLGDIVHFTSGEDVENH